MGEQHLDLLAIAPRLRKRFGLGEGARDVARGLIDAAQDLALRGLGAAVRLQRATPAVVHSRKIGKQVAVSDVAGRGQRFAGWAHVAIARLVIDEVLA